MSDILIVDDERDIRELISDILEDEGFTTRLAGNSDDAMKEVHEKRPGLLILDIWLKDSKMDGIDILKAVKTDYPEVPVVIISGHGNIEIAVAAIRQGAYDFHRKALQYRPAFGRYSPRHGDFEVAAREHRAAPQRDCPVRDDRWFGCVSCDAGAAG